MKTAEEIAMNLFNQPCITMDHVHAALKYYGKQERNKALDEAAEVALIHIGKPCADKIRALKEKL